MSSDSVRTSTVILASAGLLATGLLGKSCLRSSCTEFLFWEMHSYLLLDISLTYSIAYAVYFDHKRQTDPQFRKALKKSSRKEAKVAKEEAEALGVLQKKAIRAALEEAQEEGFPADVEEREAYFMNQVGQGETLCQDGGESCFRIP